SVTLQTVNNSPIGSALEENKVFIGDSSGEVSQDFISVADLRKSDGDRQFPTLACTPDQVLTWTALDDSFTCQDIAIDMAQVTDLPVLGSMAEEDAADYVARSGD